MKHYLSFGGGVNSVALYLLMEDLGMDFEAVFVDHGGDWPETYEYVDYFIATGRPITILKPEYWRKSENKTYDDLYDFCWDRKLVPSMLARFCTRDFKITPVSKYIDRPCFLHLGIDAGEAHRAQLKSVKEVEHRFLLIEEGVNREGCKQLIRSAGLDVPDKSGCYFCPFQRVGEWRKLRRVHPHLFCNVQKLEKRNIDDKVSKGKKTFTLRNDGRTLDQTINEKQKALPGMEEIEYPPCNCGL